MFSIITKPIDTVLNKITMYRLVLYMLIVFWVYALVLSFFNLLPFKSIDLFLSTIFVLAISWSANKIFSSVFKALTNLESVYISSLILILIVTPARSISDYIFLLSVCVLAMGSKYILAINKKHIFNPVAFSIVVTSLFSIGYASWWVGTSLMLPIVLICGILIVRKIQRADLIIGFLASALFVISFFSLIKGFDIFNSFYRTLLETPVLFFSFIMLTEPLTTPPTKKLQLIYGIVVGILFSPQIHIASFYTTPELSLLIGNVFSYLVSPKQKLMLTLKEKIKLSPDIYDFVFNKNSNFSFSPGQYLEWTLGLNNPDSRGNRRYFTIASSPKEETLRIGVKFYENSSSFKKKLLSLSIQDKVLAGSLSGDFTLPKDESVKLVFIAGGIGITPFRSIVKHLLDENKKLDIVIFYSNKFFGEIVYKDIFDKAFESLGIKTIYNLTDVDNIPKNWNGEVGRLNNQTIKNNVPDFKKSLFYLSGPHNMVSGFEEVLHDMGVPNSKIKKDFFPGYA